MSVVLLALLIARPAPDESARVVESLVTRMDEAGRIGEEDPGRAIRLLDELLDDPKGRDWQGRSGTVRACREEAVYRRGGLRLRVGGARSVAEEMTALIRWERERLLARCAGLVGALADAPLGAALRFPPESPLSRWGVYRALELRAEAYEALGRDDEARADRAEAEQLLREFDPHSDPTPWAGSGGWPLIRFVGPRLVAGCFALMLPVFFLLGLRQRRDARGTWRRLFGVSFALAALQTTPLLAAYLLLLWRPASFFDSALPYVAGGVFGINLLRHFAYLSAVRWQQAREPIPLLEDAAVLCRIAAIAGRMGVSPPVTRLVRSPTSLQANNALIVGLAAPTMVLFDGILYRLSGEERDAIIAHELAHLANRTFWLRLAGGAACGVAVVAAGVYCSALVAFALEAALLLGTWLILSRALELDCDRRAARAIGHRRAFSALSKIHTDQPFVGVLEFLIGALNTHPSRDERLDAVRRDAPAGDSPPVDWDTRLLGLRRLASLAAAGSWLAVVASCLLWAYLVPGSDGPALPLALMVAGLFVLSWVRQRQLTRRDRRLLRSRRRWPRRLAWLVPAVVWGFFFAQLVGPGTAFFDPLTSIAVMVAALAAWVVLALLGPAKADKLNQRIAIAVQSGDFPKALALAESKPAVVAGSTELRYNHALVRIVLGRRGEALADLERLRADDPGFKMTSALLLSVYADEGEYARALELAARLSRDLPAEPIGPHAESWMLRMLGRPDEAEGRAREALGVDRRAALAHLTLGAVALDRGDHASAREHLARAEGVVPGDTDAALFAAELALATDDAGAEAAVRRAVDAARNNPLAFATKAAARLAQRLEARRRAAPG